MKKCFNSFCENGKEVEYLDDDDTKVVTDEDCYICNGTGEVEDYCYCHSYTPSECACGAWTIEEMEQFYEHEEQFYNEDFEEEE